jgi:hypothetical protein
MQLKKLDTSFHAHHSPMGAHSSLTCGMHGANGGMAMEKGQPAEGGVLVGYEDARGVLHSFPFSGLSSTDRERYVSGASMEAAGGQAVKEQLIPSRSITRDYGWATDTFSAEGLTFEIITPFFSLPDPAKSSSAEQRFACCPALLVRVTLDNTKSAVARRFFFGLSPANSRWASIQAGKARLLTTRDSMGMATLDEVETVIDFTIESAMHRKHATPDFLLGQVAGFVASAPPRSRKSILVAVGFFKEGNATYGRKTRYWYNRYFKDLPDVLRYALKHADRYLAEARARDRELDQARLSDDQKFLIAHSTHSYWGSTEWLEENGQPRWVVNEGEYLMMNTFDLTVDMLFFEMRFNPWTVRNVLEQFVRDYSYRDRVFDPARPGKSYPGGISFTHDMGVMNQFSPPGRSSYETAGLDRECFSYMTCEQLTNWVCCVGVYYTRTGDRDFLRRHRKILEACLESLQNRDHPDPRQRTGIMKFESSRTQGGGEITTYDSLDHSLGQARNNIYLASKCWAAYVALEHLFGVLGLAERQRAARSSAKLCAHSIVDGYDEARGFIPAVLERGNASAIIPAIEGLIFPHEMGLTQAVSPRGPYAKLVRTLRQHLENVLQPGVCLYPDGGWKLSSTADNSWMSKIALCQHITRTILNVKQAKRDAQADAAHVRWQIKGSEFHACSDQFRSGVALGSKYYPRIVTTVLWMKDDRTRRRATGVPAKKLKK